MNINVDLSHYHVNIQLSMDNKPQSFVKTAFLVIICLGWIIFTYFRTPSHGIETETAPQTGFIAPAFDLISLDGTSYSGNVSNNMPLMINFWASWCKPCQAEMPALEKMYGRYGDKILFLAVNNTKQDSIPSILAFTDSYKLTFPILLDSEENVFKKYQISALPTTFFINRDGVIEEIVIGGPMSESLLEIRLLNLLEKP